jgi:hypothetical protein
MNNKMISPIIAAAVTMIVYFATKSLWHMWIGPILITFFTIWSFQASLMDEWKFNHLALLPCMIGILGFLQGQYTCFSWVAEYMSSSHELPISNYALIATSLFSFSKSFEVLLLGAGLSLLLFTISTCVLSCRRQIKKS